MTIEVLLFAQLREALGVDRMTVSLHGEGTVDDVIRMVAEQPGWDAVSSIPLRVAVNERIVERDQRLTSGDRVALLTPVSGG